MAEIRILRQEEACLKSGQTEGDGKTFLVRNVSLCPGQCQFQADPKSLTFREWSFFHNWAFFPEASTLGRQILHTVLVGPGDTGCLISAEQQRVASFTSPSCHNRPFLFILGSIRLWDQLPFLPQENLQSMSLPLRGVGSAHSLSHWSQGRSERSLSERKPSIYSSQGLFSVLPNA